MLGMSLQQRISEGTEGILSNTVHKKHLEEIKEKEILLDGTDFPLVTVRLLYIFLSEISLFLTGTQ